MPWSEEHPGQQERNRTHKALLVVCVALTVAGDLDRRCGELGAVR